MIVSLHGLSFILIYFYGIVILIRFQNVFRLKYSKSGFVSAYHTIDENDL